MTASTGGAAAPQAQSSGLRVAPVDAKTTAVDVTMGRFIGVPDTPRQDQTWALPACFQTSTAQPQCEVIERPKQTVRLNGCERPASATNSSAVFANADSRGYYFPEYSPESARALARRVSRYSPKCPRTRSPGS